MEYIIERFERNIAIIENKNMEFFEIPKKILPKDAREGDVLNITIDKEKTEKRKKDIKEKFEKLFTD